MLCVEVQGFEGWDGLQVEGEGVGFCDGVVVRASVELRDAAGFGVLAAVEPQVALGVDGDGAGLQPEVDEVEVVGRFVHEEAAAVALVAVPAAEVVGAVGGVEQPLEVDGGDGADGAGAEELVDFGVVGGVAVVERHADDVGGALDGRDDVKAPGGVDSHGLFGDDVAAELEGADDVEVVGAVDGGDDDLVGLGRFDHAVKVSCEECGHLGVPESLEVGVGIVETGLVGIAQADDAGCSVVSRRDGTVVEVRTAAGPDDGVPLSGVSGQGSIVSGFHGSG